MTGSKSESKAVTTSHVCHWQMSINVTAIIIVAFIALLVCLFWKHIPTMLDRLDRLAKRS